MAGYVQVNEIMNPGDTISAGEYLGTVEKVTRFTTIVKDDQGRQHSSPNNYLVKNTVSK